MNKENNAQFTKNDALYKTMKLTKNSSTIEKIEKDDLTVNDLSQESKAVFDNLFEQYDDVQIHTLREVGKEIGLTAATTYSKRELAMKVALAQASNLIRLDLSDKCVEAVSNDEALELIDDYKNRRFILNPADVSGVIEVFDTAAWIRPNLIKTDALDIFIPMRIVNDYDLKSGDFVKGKARAIVQANRLGLFKVETINDMESSEFERKTTLNKRAEGQNSLISFDGGEAVYNISEASPFIKGQAKLIINNDISLEFMQAFRKQRIMPIGILLDDSRRKNLPADLVGDYSVFRLNPLETLRADGLIDTVIDYAKTMEDSVVIINNADSLSKESIAKLIEACGIFEKGSVSLLMFTKVIEMTDKVNWMGRVADSMYSS